jgi:hypothetical protein
MRGDVEMQDAASRVFSDEEAIGKFEAHSGHGKEIHGDDRFAVVGQEGSPALARIIPPIYPDQKLSIPIPREVLTTHNGEKSPLRDGRDMPAFTPSK